MEHDQTLEQLRAATIAEITTWASETIMKRGVAYARERRVADLALTAEGWLLAWVDGGDRYATLVGFDQGLLSSCTCPYGAACKHAVAVLVAFQTASAQGRSTPEADEDDERLLLLEDGADSWDEDDENDEDEDDEPGGALVPTTPAPATLAAYLAGLTREQLVAILGDLAARFSDVRSTLESRRAAESGDVGMLVDDARRLLAQVDAGDDWDDWGRGGTVNLGPVRDRLALLLRRGHADAVVDFGDDLLRMGADLSERGSDDAGSEVAWTMQLVFEALAGSHRPADERMLKALDWELSDDYGLTDSAEEFWAQPFDQADWSAVADVLLARLGPPPRREPAAPTPAPPTRRGRPRAVVATVDPTASLIGTYRRDKLSNRAIEALDHAGRADDALALCEREAEATGSYTRLVRRLLDAGRSADAERWIAAGIAATAGGRIGVARELREIQRGIWTAAEEWPLVAALDAEEFLQSPSMPALQKLRGSAERVDAWPAVRAAALRYLETGERPQAQQRSPAGEPIPPWPLPPSGLPVSDARPVLWPFPQVGTLIELAAAEGRPDDVLLWYDRLSPATLHTVRAEMVANAVAERHPDRAIQIWRTLAEAEVAKTSPSAYHTAADHLRRLRAVLEQHGRLGEWRPILGELREANRRKRRFIEELDALERER